MQQKGATTAPAAEPLACHFESGTPVFALSRPTHHLQAFGVKDRFHTIDAARSALADGSHPQVVGALPFDLTQPAALTVPARFVKNDHRWQMSPSVLPPVDIVRTEPEPAEHARRISSAISVLGDHDAALAKVVLARTVHLHAHAPIEPIELLARLVTADTNGNGFLADLSPSGSSLRGHHLIGSSPEVLVRKTGSTVTCHPLAGSAPRLRDRATDRANGELLVKSAKDRYEHALVVDALATALQPLCSRLDVPSAPALTRTPELWHLGTHIEGTVRDHATTALDLAVALHPTPAVCGTPTVDASEYILAHEEERSFYAGTVGWCDSAGNGEWMVSIRCAQLSADGRTIRASAGGGIVAGSNPDLELAETTTKLRTILSALGIT